MIAAITKESKTKEREQVERLAIERKWKEKKSRGKGKILEGTTLDTSSPQSPGFSVWQPPSPTVTSDLYIIIASLKPALQSLARECQTGDEPCVPATVYSLRMTYRVPAYNKRMWKLLHHTVLSLPYKCSSISLFSGADSCAPCLYGSRHGSDSAYVCVPSQVKYGDRLWL